MKKDNATFQWIVLPIWLSICLAVSSAVYIGLFGTAYAEQVIEGYLYIYPSNMPRQFPEKGTSIVEFHPKPDRDISGSSETEPDSKNGYWIGRFNILSPDLKDGRITVEPKWKGAEGKFFSLRSPDIRVPILTKLKLELQLYEADRFAEKRSSEADSFEKDLRRTYGACFSKTTISEISVCWNKLEKTDNSRFILARAQTLTTIDLYRQAHQADPQTKYLYKWASLENRAGLFCDATDTFNLIDIERATSSKILLASVYGIEAAEWCARASPSATRPVKVSKALGRAKSLATSPKLEKHPALKKRILSAWLRTLQLLSDDPQDLVKVAHTLFQDAGLRGHWDAFRDAAAHHLKIDFKDPETSHFTVAGRIEDLCIRLGQRC